MKSVRIANKTANEIMEIVRALRAKGLVQGIDFDFSYTKIDYVNSTNWGGEFRFHTDTGQRYSTFFALGWVN